MNTYLKKFDKTLCMFTIFASLVLAFTASASVIVPYDSFDTPATGTPDAAKWTVTGTASNSGGVVTLGENSAIGKLDKDLSFGTYYMTLGDPGTGSRIFGLIDHASGIDGYINNAILLRNDGGNDLKIIKAGLEVGGVSLSYFATATAGDTFIFEWSADNLSIMLNDATVYTTSDPNLIPTVDLRFAAQVYGGGSAISFQEVGTVIVIPEPSSALLMLLGASGLLLGRHRRK